jgi:hypothetical protein
MTNPAQVSVAAQVANLPALPMAALWVLWDRYFPRRPDKVNRTYLESRVAYKLQEAVYGGLAAKPRQRLIQIGQQQSKIPQRKVREVLHFVPGTVMVREYAGEEHRVTVTAEGRFAYAGQSYKSLSAVARQITGTPWNGLVFFNVRKTRGACV